MPNVKLPAPKNGFVEAMKIVIDKLVEGLGVDVAIAAATAEAPWLATPIVKQLFAFGVSKLAEYIDINLFKLGAKIVIRIQGDIRKDAFNKSMQPIINGVATNDDVQKAKDDLDRLINRNRP